MSVPRLDVPEAIVLNMGKQGRHGARNWVYVSCVHRDIRSGEWSRASVLAMVVVINFCRYYGATVPSFLSIACNVGFITLNCILGGQALASIANISWTCVVTVYVPSDSKSHSFVSVGIVIISVISLVVSKRSCPVLQQSLISSIDRCLSVDSGFSTGEHCHPLPQEE